MGFVTKEVVESVGNAKITTTYRFGDYEDFEKWESIFGKNVENVKEAEKTSRKPVKFEAGKKYRIVGNTSQHAFDEGDEVEVESIDSDGDALAFLLDQEYGDAQTYFYIAPEDVEEIE